jgi:uncharacterized protein (DUF1800 family)
MTLFPPRVFDMAPSTLPPLDKVDPVKAWQPWEPTQDDPWNLKWAAHLYRRAAFGGTPAELKTAVQKGHKATLKLLVEGNPLYKNFEKEIESSAWAFSKQQPSPQEQMFQPREPYPVRVWWTYWIVNSYHPLREKMTLFWHNHFATSIAKVQLYKAMVQQNLLMRKHALGKFGPFLQDMSKDVAMIIWLDGNTNVKGKVNENYAREIQELFSLGVGNYTEKDIQEAARAFTGWHQDGEQFTFNAAQHDNGEKSFHGVKGNLDGGDCVKIILEQPACARFLVTKLYRYLISELEVPPKELIDPLADRLRKSEYDISDVVRTMISSNHFFSDYAFRRRIKSPVEFVIGAVNSTVEARQAPRPLVRRMDAMGQALFSPPNVKGWPGAQAWLSTATVLARQNFGQALAMGTLWDETIPEPRFNQPEIEFEAPDGFPQPGTGPKKPGSPEEPPRDRIKDPARHIEDLKSAGAEKIVDRLLDVYVPGGVGKNARAKLIAFIEDGKPTDKALDRRVREAVHAIFSMPEYQLA